MTARPRQKKPLLSSRPDPWRSDRHGDIHFGQHPIDSIQQGANVWLIDVADISDAKAIHAAEFAWINHHSTAGESGVKVIELKSWVSRIIKGGDDRALTCGIQKRPKPELLHAGEERSMIGLIAGGSARHA